MSHALPPVGHSARDLFDVADVVKIAMGELPVPTFGRGLASARRFVREEKAARAVVFFAVCSSTDVLGLYRVGKRGGWRRLWAFGPIGRKARLA